MRVPMIARWPGHVPAGRVSDQVWAFWDLLPTMADLVGAPPQHETFDPKPDAPAEIQGEMRAISSAVPGIRVCERLPDLKTDLGERHDVAADHPAEVARARQILSTARTESALFPVRQARAPLEQPSRLTPPAPRHRAPEYAA